MASALWSSPSPSSLYENQLTNLVPAHKVRPRDHGTTHHHHPPATKFRLVKAQHHAPHVLFIHPLDLNSKVSLEFLPVQAAKGDGRTKPKSMICSDCDGNGAVLCSQCKGSGVNSEDLFNGQFKAGDSCWLCG
ncbi:protein BUNDLE SHEATH DEFECTIVE 2, chloroplastic-like isoform X2 [Rhodamnia argentea]|nr:protein BUNDLE SHEATH DEFECTIVE 2, chloroplastic-like isoform X2 [Rhodamnia argentea]